MTAVVSVMVLLLPVTEPVVVRVKTDPAVHTGLKLIAYALPARSAAVTFSSTPATAPQTPVDIA